MLLAFEQELTLGMCTCLWHVLGNHQNKLGCLHFYTLQLVYNSQLYVFYSAQSPVTIEGYATNWTHSSWEEIYPQVCKLSANF